MDDIDRASQLETMQRKIALDKQAKKNRHHLPSLSECIDCDDAIPEKRRELGGVERCCECQTDFERECTK